MKKTPTAADVRELVGPLFKVWEELCQTVEESYDTDRLWNPGGKKWDVEYKYRRGGKTLCALYAKKGVVGLMMIFGKDERDKVEEIKNELSAETCRTYDEATVYHDGKWVMFTPTDASQFGDYMKLLAIKRKPNKTSK